MTIEKTVLSPSEFMRGRRREQFSDSRIEASDALDKDLLEYKLESITSRSEEKQFEHLARKLAERLICPNLIPQTGPTGGGDSKVDTETYPVHEEISTRWYEGNVEAADERWGFAVSAKKQWQGKLRSDMKSISSTGRGYKVAFFVSNQFIPDKSKSKFQDELIEEHGFDVRILDRTWLLEAIIDKGNQDVAILALNLSSSIKKKQLGPNDYAKQQALDELEIQIADTNRYSGVEYQLVEDCISAAVISRELEVNRHITDGRYDRAIRLARKHGSSGQVTSALYQKAWTAVYWHDDFGVLLDLYDEIEIFSINSTKSADAEKAINLWQTLHTAVLNEVLTTKDTQLDVRANRLLEHLEDMSKNKDRPNNAANAQWLRLGMQILQHAADEAVRDSLLRDYGELLTSSQHLGGFTFDRAYECFEVFEAAFGELDVYDDVFEMLLPAVEARKSDIIVADKLFNRGIRKLRSGRIHEAIDFLGRALPKLVKAEKKERLVRCLTALATAYSQIDLFWAAHANNMSALSMLLIDFEDTCEIDPLLPMLLDKMFWGEVSVGRIPHALWYLELELSILSQTDLDEDDEEFKEDYQNKDGILAMLLLKANAEQLEDFTGLVDFFEQNNLFMCSVALLFSFGGPEYLKQHEYVPNVESNEDILDIMRKLWDQPAQSSLPKCIETFSDTQVCLVSVLLGIRWEVSCDNNPWCIRIGESYLGFLEAFLSTSLAHDAIGTMEKAFVQFKLASPVEDCPNNQGLELSVGSGSNLATIVVWPEKFPIGSLRTRQMNDFFVYSLVNILPRILISKDTKKLMAAIGDTEEGLSRSIIFADVFASASNVFTDCESPSLTKWSNDANQFEIVADPPCNLALQNSMMKKRNINISDLEFGDDEPPLNILNASKMKHGSHKVISVIDLELWDKAKWKGVGIAMQPDAPTTPLLLALLFTDGEAGRKIFQNWISELGPDDLEDKIRVLILTGVDKSNKNAYTLAISSNLADSGLKELDSFVLTSRVQTMDNPDPRNLVNFRNVFAKTERYSLVPATVREDGSAPEFHFDHAIGKRNIILREAWTVGLNDPDSMAITSDINPIIPDDQDNPPINELLKMKKKISLGKQS